MVFHIDEDTVLDLLDREYSTRGFDLITVSLLTGSVMNPNGVVDLANSGRRYAVRCFLRNRDPARLGVRAALG